MTKTKTITMKAQTNSEPSAIEAKKKTGRGKSWHHETWRCDHCGKWVGEYKLYTLYDMANGHDDSESIAVCGKCSNKTVKGERIQTYSPEYWFEWLEKRKNGKRET